MEDISNNATWLLCPVCKSKTRIMVREDTELKNFPLFCPKCKHSSIVNVNKLNMTVIKEPDAETIICEKEYSQLSALFISPTIQ